MDQKKGIELKDIYQEPQPSTVQRYFIIVKLAIPSVICLIVVQGQQLINLYYAGHLNNSAILAAIGVGNLIQNCVVDTLFRSLNSSLENLVSHAVGAKNMENCGIYLNRGTFMICIGFVFAIVVLIFSEKILLSFGQDPMVSKFTS